MADERPQSDGAIYQNNYKKTDKQPDWTGKIEIHRVALWDRTSKNGNDYKYARLDIPMKQNTETKAEEPKPEEEKRTHPVLEDIDVPF